MSNPRKVLRSPTLRRKSKTKPLSERVHLEKVLGVTASNTSAVDCDPHTGTVAYPAGCVVVLLHPKKKQSHLISRKTITCLSFSRDGRHIVTGESGHQPAVRVWDLEEKTQVAEFHGHKFAINCVKFSPNQRYIVSIGSQHDGMVNVWNWKSNAKIASNKVATKVTDLAFNEEGNVFVTTGNRHVKFWYLDVSKSRVNETVPLMGRSGILGEQRNNFFCAVCCGRGARASTTYSITKSGLLCEFNEKRLLDKWVELRTTSANAVTVGEELVYVGCADGIVRVFSADSLHFIATLPRPHYLGVDVSKGVHPSQIPSPPSNVRYPDTVAVVLDDINKKVTCVYNDHSIYIWDVKDVRKVGKSRSFLFHSGCIWDVEVYPMLEGGNKAALPPGSFITCSGDDTIRVWNLDPHMNSEDTYYKKNIYSNELLKIVYTDDNYNNILDIDFNPAGKTDKTDTTCLDKNGVRCIRSSPDGQHLASGDRMGNIRVHEMQFMGEVAMLEAHDSEVLCLEYTRPETGVHLLASASRDRLIHVFDLEQNYGLIQTLDDHSSAITSVRFTEQDGQLNMLSCGADKSLLFRSAHQDPDFQFVLNRHLVGKTTLYDMDVDATKKFVATACQDRNVRIYNIKNGKQKRCYKGAVTDDGTLIKIQLDPSGSYAATSCSDKNLAIYDFFSGECMASMFGHSELVTGLKFMNDLKHLITVSGDGCIFVWRIPSELTENMRQRLIQVGKLPREPITTQDIRRATYVPTTPKVLTKWDNNNSSYQILAREDETDANANLCPPDTPKTDWRFSVGHLPSWAKKQVMQEPQGKNAAPNQPAPSAPRGRWASRVENQGIVMKSMLDENSAIQLSLADSMDRRRFTVEPDTLAGQVSDLRRDTMVINKNAAVPIITDDDENNRDDDDDDDEFCSNREQVEKRLLEDERKHAINPHMTPLRGSEPFMSSQKHINMDPSRWSDFGLKRENMEEENDVEEEEEEDEGDADGKEVIYLPDEGSESEGTIASSFQVFEGDANSYRDAESEGTDPLSMSDEESQPPTPTTPIDTSVEFINGLSEPEKEGLFRSNFENLSSSPAHQEKFGNSLEALEQQLNGHDPSRFLTSRLSMSSRFLSRAQQQHLRNIAMNRAQTQSPAGAHMNTVQRRKEEMTRAVEETRKRLQTLGWISRSENVPEKDVGAHAPSATSEVNDDLPSPPIRLSRQDFNEIDPPTRGRASMGGERAPSRGRKEESKAGRHSLDPGSSRKWKSMVDIVGGRTTPVFSLPGKQSLRSKTPTPTRTSSLSSQATSPPPRYVTKTEVRLQSPSRSRSRGPRDEDEDFAGIPTRSRSEKNLAFDKDVPTKGGKSSLRRVHSYQMHTESSVAKTSKTENGSSSPRRTSSGIRRARLNGGLKKQYKSTPDLASQKEEDEDVSISSTRTVDDFADLASHVSGIERSAPKPMPRRSMPASKITKDGFSIQEFGQSAPGPNDFSDSSSSASLSSGDAYDKLRRTVYSSSVPGEGGPGEGDLGPRFGIGKEDADRLAMPPPTIHPSSSKSKQFQDTFVQKAAKAKQTPVSDLTLAQAKEILMGKSGLLHKHQDSTDSESSVTQDMKDRFGKDGMDRSPMDLPEKDQSPSKDRLAQQSDRGKISGPHAKNRVEITNFKMGSYPGQRSYMSDRRGSGSESTSSREGDSLRTDKDSGRERRPARRTPLNFPTERSTSTPPQSSSPPPSPSKSVRERASMFEEMSPDKHSRSFSPSKFKRSPSPVKKFYGEQRSATLPRTRERRAPSPVKMPLNIQSTLSPEEGDFIYPCEGSPTTATNQWEARRASADILANGGNAPWRRGSRSSSFGSPDKEGSPSTPEDKPAKSLTVRFSGVPSSSSPSDTSSTTTTPSTSIAAPTSSPPGKVETSSPRTHPSVPTHRSPPTAQAGTGTITKPPSTITEHPPAQEVREGEPDMEIKRPDKSRQFPPTTLNTTPPSEVTSGKVTLAQPSPSASDRPDRTKLTLPLEKPAPTSTSAVSEEQDDQFCYQLIKEFENSSKRMTEALTKANQQQNSHQVAVLSTAIKSARTSLAGALSDHTGSTENLQRDVKDLIGQNSAQLAEGICQLLLKQHGNNQRGQPTVTDV